MALRERSATELRGGTVLIAGDAGIGKSRLLTEFAARPTRARWACVRVRCEELAVSYAPFIRAFEELGGKRELRASREIAAALSALTTVDPADGDAVQRQHARNEAVLGALRFAARRLGQLTLVIDDVHWSDRSSLEALRSVSSVTRELPLVVVLAYRQADIASDHARTHAIAAIEREGADRIVLEPLAFGNIAELLATLIPSASTKVLRRVYDLSEGRPYVAEELARSVVERGGDADDFEATLTLRGAVLERVAQLTPEARTIIERAAVLGRNFLPGDLLALGAAKEQIFVAFRSAVDLQLLEEREVGGESWFRFRHALTREILYRNLLALERRDVHRAIAEHLAAAETRTAELAYHLSAAGETAAAVIANERAGDEAAGLAAFADAAAFYARALALDVLEATDAARLALKLAESLHHSGDLDGLLAATARDTARLESAGLHDEALALRNVAIRATCLTRLADALPILEIANATLRPETSSDLRFELELLNARVLRKRYRMHEAFEACLRAEAILAMPAPQQRNDLLISKAWTYLFLDDLPNAERALDLRRAQRLDGVAGLVEDAGAIGVMAQIAYRRGDIAGAFAQKLEAAALWERAGRVHFAMSQRQTAAYYAADLGDFAFVQHLAEQCRREGIGVGDYLAAAGACVARALGEDPEPHVARFERAISLGAPFLIEKLSRDLPWMLSADRDRARTIVRRGLAATTADALDGDFMESVIEFGDDEDVARALRLYEHLGPPKDDHLLLGINEAMVRARLALRDHRPLEAADHARRAAAAARRSGQWLELAHALTIAGDHAAAREELLRVGAVAELARLEKRTATAAAARTMHPGIKLTSREEQIARLIVSGLSSREAAERLAIAPRTVETHIANVYLKLAVSSRAELAAHFAAET